MDATRSRKRMGEQPISDVAKYTGFLDDLACIFLQCFGPIWIFIKLIIGRIKMIVKFDCFEKIIFAVQCGLRSPSKVILLQYR